MSIKKNLMVSFLIFLCIISFSNSSSYASSNLLSQSKKQTVMEFKENLRIPTYRDLRKEKKNAEVYEKRIETELAEKIQADEPLIENIEETQSISESLVSSGHKTGQCKIVPSSCIIAIDAGHQRTGNSDQEPIGPGASTTKAKVTTGTTGVVSDTPESELNLTVSMKLRDELTERGYQVIMIRESQDVNISNAERASIANDSGAEIFLRIHANGSTNQSVNGIVTMCPSASNPYVGYLYENSYRLSSLIVNNMCSVTGAHNHGVQLSDDMSGINWCTIPVCIIEMGYMSNPEEDILLNDSSYQALLVQGIADAVDQYFTD